MNGPGDIPLTHSTTPDTRPCGLISIIPTLGMSSCRGRAEAFARRLQSKLRTLGSQNEDNNISQESESIINGGSSHTWMRPQDSDQTVRNLQPLRHESDSFFDFDCELESPGSPVDECEYLRLIETASNTPHNSVAESGYVCASAASSHSSSSDGPYYDPETSESEQRLETRSKIAPSELSTFVSVLTLNHTNGKLENVSNNNDPSNANRQHLTNEFPKDLQITNIGNGISTDDSVQTASAEEKANVESTAVVNNTISYDLPTIQDQVLRELQMQSEQYISSILDNTHYNGNEPEHASVTTPVQIADKAQVHEQFTVLGNVNPSELDDVLEIVLIEAEPRASVPIVVDGIADDVSKLSLNYSQQHTYADTDTSNEIIYNSKDKANEDTTELLNRKQEQLSALDTDDEDDCRPLRVRRCSSLKTGKTPPGTPGRKKIVRFADALGLDLADVKTFLDEIPTIPKSAFEDLEIMETEPPIQLGPRSDKLLMPLFQQPGGQPSFLDVVRDRQVSLENAVVSDHINQTITGTVRVRNLDFHKSVHIRYSLDNWRSFADLQANYVNNSCDGFSDIFTFVVFGNSLNIGQRLEFAVRFQCKGQQFWDNNFGANYCFQCLPSLTSSTQPAPTPAASIPSHHSNNNCSVLSPAAGDTWYSSFY